MPLNPDLQRLSTEAEGTLPIPERPSLLPIPAPMPTAPATIQRTLPDQGLPDVQQLLAEDLQRIQQAGNRTGLQWFLQGTRDPAAEARVRTILPLLSQYRQEQANLVTAQNQVLGFLKPLLLDFHAQSPEAQAASRPLVTKIIQRASDIGQLGLDTPTIEAGLASPDFAGLLDVYTGKNPFWTDQRKQQLAVGLGQAKTAGEKQAAYENVLKDVKADVANQVEQQAPGMIATIREQLQLPPNTPMSEGQLRAAFTRQYPALSANPLVSEAINKVFSNATLMSSLNVQTGKAAEAGQVTKAQALATQETPQGQAQLALTKAQEKAALTPIVTPLQQGAGYTVTEKGPGQVPRVEKQPETTTQQVSRIREEFTRLSKDFTTVRDFYAQIPEAVRNPSAAGDLALIFSYMKILDPTSVVREGEQASAQNATGVPERIRNLYNRIMVGERLNPTQREDFQAQAGRLLASRVKSQEALESQYRDIATRAGIKPEDVVVDLVGRFRDVGKPKKMPKAKLVP